jgi:hypothetical protein
MESQDPNQVVRNTDQEQMPKREGDAIANTSREEHDNDRDRNAPVPEEESYERDSRNQRQR